jgi:hypothetical protein
MEGGMASVGGGGAGWTTFWRRTEREFCIPAIVEIENAVVQPGDEQRDIIGTVANAW